MPKCDWCDKDFKNQGGLNLHKSIHCKKKPTSAAVDDGCEGGCDWRLLNGSNGIENKALERGFKEVCDGCLTLR